MTDAIKTWTRGEIDAILQRNDRAVERAMILLLKRQTHEERQTEQTLLDNGVGFCSWAAKPGTYYAKWILSGRSLTGKFVKKARKIALRHSRQITEEANVNEVIKAMTPGSTWRAEGSGNVFMVVSRHKNGYEIDLMKATGEIHAFHVEVITDLIRSSQWQYVG